MKAASIYVYHKTDDKELPFAILGGGGQGNNQYMNSIYSLFPEAPLGQGYPTDFSDSLNQISFAFSGSNWKSAKLPKAIHDLLTQKNVSEKYDQDIRINGKPPCTPRAPW